MFLVIPSPGAVGTIFLSRRIGIGRKEEDRTTKAETFVFTRAGSGITAIRNQPLQYISYCALDEYLTGTEMNNHLKFLVGPRIQLRYLLRQCQVKREYVIRQRCLRATVRLLKVPRREEISA
ncbi:hypothetical protein AcV5_008310 [Taiwanofungus camphoratus]|nr:hypothetical protein AcV5_008310 [Antrodia cinnamomea]KAI0955713.1 hypothetical protein AcV7_006302 [Antrodia cinnamomea]